MWKLGLNILSLCRYYAVKLPLFQEPSCGLEAPRGASLVAVLRSGWRVSRASGKYQGRREAGGAS